MRVLAITHSLATNGAAVLLADLLLRLRGEGWSVDALCPANEALSASLADAGVRFVASAKVADYDVALVNTLIDAEWVLRIGGRIPTVWMVHEGMSMLDSPSEMQSNWSKAFQLSSCVVFDSPWQRDSVFKSFLLRMDPERTLCIAPGLSQASRAAANRHGIQPNRQGTAGHIAWLGSVYPRKHPHDLVRAALHMAPRPAHCHFIGSLQHYELVDAQTRQDVAQHPELFTLHGAVADDRKSDLLRQSAVYCSPSADETFCMSAVEAAAHGIAVLLSDLPCYAGIWRHGVNCLLHPVGHTDVLAANLQAVLSDAALSSRLAHAASQTAQRFLAQDPIGQMMDAIVQAVRTPVLVQPPAPGDSP